MEKKIKNRAASMRQKERSRLRGRWTAMAACFPLLEAPGGWRRSDRERDRSGRSNRVRSRRDKDT